MLFARIVPTVCCFAFNVWASHWGRDELAKLKNCAEYEMVRSILFPKTHQVLTANPLCSAVALGD